MTKHCIKLVLVCIFILVINHANSQCLISPIPTITETSVMCISSSTLTASSIGSLTTGWYANSFGGDALGVGNTYVTPTLTGTTVFYVAQFEATSSASISLPPQLTTFSLNSRGYYFTAPVSFVITEVRVPTDASTGNSNIAIVKLPIAPPLWPAITNTLDVLYLTQNNTSGTGTISVNIPVYAGDIIGVLGDRAGINSYANGPTTQTLGSNTITLNRLGMQHLLVTSFPLGLFTETTGNISRVELYTSLGCLNALTAYTVNTTNPPIVASTTNPIICVSQTVTLVATGAFTYTWNPGNIIGPSISVSPVSSTIYTVTGTHVNGCQNLSTLTQSVSICTGFENIISDKTVAVYPNPSKGLFTLELISTSKVIIVDAFGKIVYSQSFEKGMHTIDIIQFAEGLYHIKVTSNDKSSTVRIMKN